MLLLGAHQSISGGMHNAIDLAGRLACNCLQVFVRNQRQWNASPLTSQQVDMWLDALKNADPPIVHVIAHSGYLINLASDRAEIRRKSQKALHEELHRCRRLKIDRMVLHPGSHRGQGLETGIKLIASALDKAIDAVNGEVTVLLENTAGAGDTIGATLEELAAIIDHCRHGRELGCCLDTCHLFAAGYEFTTRYRFDRLLYNVDRTVGIDRVGCIHVNDTKSPLASHRDRHEGIGDGIIGMDAFRHIMRSRTLAAIPKIIETPKDPAGSLKLDRRNLNTLRKLARSSA